MVARLQRIKKSKWIYWLGGIILAFIIVVVGLIFNAHSQLGSAIDTMHTPLERNPERQKEVQETFEEK